MQILLLLFGHLLPHTSQQYWKQSQDHDKVAKPKSPTENLRDPVNGAEQAHQDEEAVPEPQNLQEACFSYVVKICPI